MHTHNVVIPRRTTTPTISLYSRWNDEVDNLTYRVTRITAIGIEVRCLSLDTGKVWETRLARECFNELVEVAA